MLIQFQQKHKHIVQGAAETALECSACALLLLKDTELQTSSYKYITHTHSRSKKNISLLIKCISVICIIQTPKDGF